MKRGILFTLTIIIASSAVFSGFMFAVPDLFDAYGGISLDPENVASSIIVHVTREETNESRTYDSFSRIGFVSGEKNFLLESIPSLDKKEFYQFVKDSLENKDFSIIDDVEIDVDVAIYSGSGKLIETLEYERCELDEYFVHSVDSLGKIQFIEGQDSIEIREVAKFECKGFALSLDGFGTSLNEEIIYEKSIPIPNEGDLKYNAMTNTLQRYQDGEWVDISGKGGPGIQR